MSGFGSFSQEAYDQLREAYAQQLARAEEIEQAGVQIGSETLGVETAPVRSDWLDKTGLWKYPDGKGEYQDVEQKQQDLLAALRNEQGEIETSDDDQVDLSSLSDEELDAMIDEIVGELEEDDDEVDEDDESVIGAMSDEEIDALINELAASEEDEDDLNLEDMSDEELDSMLDEILAEVEREEEEAPVRDADTIAREIAQLKAELAEMAGEEEEEEEENEEIGEASEVEEAYETNDEEATESEDDTDEEEPSDDEHD